MSIFNQVCDLRTAAHFSPGYKNEVAFVLSCPGRHEEGAGHPAAGNTGRNLDRLLERLGPRLDLSNLSRTQVTIANAWASIEYQAKTGRSEASDVEVKQPENIDRLASELRHISMLIVFCGMKAKLASQQLQERNLLSQSAQMAFLPHIGGLGLNKSIRADLMHRPIVDALIQRRNGRRDSLKLIRAENTNRRLEVVVERLLESRVPVHL